jgi:hypothetical protein
MHRTPIQLACKPACIFATFFTHSLKGIDMTIMKPNRTRIHSNGGNEINRKQSGDQHVLAMDDPESDPYRPHRSNRRDIQKALPSGRSTDDAGS